MRSVVLVLVVLSAGSVQAAPALPTAEGQLAFEAQWPMRFSAQAAFGEGTLLPRAKVEAGLLSKTLRTDLGASVVLLRHEGLLWTVGADAGLVGLVDVRAFPALSAQLDTTLLLHWHFVEGFVRPWGGVDVRALPAQGLVRAGLHTGVGVKYKGVGGYLTADVGGSWYSQTTYRARSRIGVAVVLPLFLL